VIDTSALVAALIQDHEHHDLARPHLRTADVVPAIVLAETYAQLRRTFRQPAAVAASVLTPWSTAAGRILATSGTATVAVLARAVELDLGGNIHDALIAQVCRHHGVPLVTLDRRQHTVALALGVESTYLLA
jgi:predicted nucleic acid-binding protein